MSAPVTPFDFDWWGIVVSTALSIALAEAGFRSGRLGYRNVFWLCLGNIVVSLLIYAANGGEFVGGWLEIAGFPVWLLLIFFAHLGFSATFRIPKNVKCFRCGYVDYPSESDEPLTRHDERAWRAFRKLADETKRSGEAET